MAAHRHINITIFSASGACFTRREADVSLSCLVPPAGRREVEVVVLFP